MPDTVKEGTYQGKPTISILTGVGRDGKEYWMTMGLAKAKAIDENIAEFRRSEPQARDRLERFVI